MKDFQAIRDAFAGTDGKRALALIAMMARADEDLFVASEDERQLAYLEGRRSLYLDILRMTKDEHDEKEDDAYCQ